MVKIGVDRSNYKLCDYHAEAIEIVKKLAYDKNADCKLRMAAIVFCKNHEAYLKSLEESDEL